MGQQEPCETEQGQMLSPVPGKAEPKEQLCWEGAQGHARQQAEKAPAEFSGN